MSLETEAQRLARVARKIRPDRFVTVWRAGLWSVWAGYLLMAVSILRVASAYLHALGRYEVLVGLTVGIAGLGVTMAGFSQRQFASALLAIQRQSAASVDG
jgi:hypothetical protein